MKKKKKKKKTRWDGWLTPRPASSGLSVQNLQSDFWTV